MNSAQDLINAGYTGYQGWGDTAALADFKATGGSGKGSANGGSTTGDNPNLHVLDNYTPPSTTDFITSTVNPMEDKAFNDYLMAARAQQTPTQMYNTFENNAGIPQLRTTASNLQGQVNDLTNTIQSVEPRVNATTQNSLVTEGQRSGMVTAQKYPLQQTLTPLSTALGNTEQAITAGEANVGNMVNYGVQSNAQQLDPFKTNLTMMNDRAARMITGFTTDAQNQLQVLLAKYNAGEKLSEAEVQNAADLTKLEKEYSLKMQEDAASSQNTINEKNSLLQKVSKSGYVYDPITGTIVASGGGTSTGTSGVSFSGGGPVDPLGLMG